jgi:hypothetical protein
MYTYGGDMRWTIENKQIFFVPTPNDVDVDKITATEKIIWEKREDDNVKWDITFSENYEKLYSLIFGQCTEYMQAKLEYMQ